MNKVNIVYQDCPEDRLLRRVENLAHGILEYLGLNNCECNILFCSITVMTQLNEGFRGKHGPTDVLSFVAEPDNFPINEKTIHLSGDIAICPDIIIPQAQEFGVSYEEELSRMLIHGILHLVGWDHGTNDPQEPMLLEQERILSSILWRDLLRT